MSITTSCPGCKSLFRLPEDLAGEQVRCQKCAGLFVVPMLAKATPETQPEVVAAPIEQPLDSPVAVETPPAAEKTSEATAAEPAPAVKPPPLPVPFDSPPRVGWAIVGLLVFLLGVFGAGGVAAIWIVTHLAAPTRVTVVPALNPGGDGLGFNNRRIDFNKDKDGFFIDRGFEVKRKRGNRPPEIPAVKGPQQILAVLDDDGRYEDQRSLVLDDPTDPGLGRFKVYLVQLEEGNTYSIKVTSKLFDPYVALFNAENRQVATSAAGFGHETAQITHRVERNGMYRIHAGAAQPVGLGAYALRIETVP